MISLSGLRVAGRRTKAIGISTYALCPGYFKGDIRLPLGFCNTARKPFVPLRLFTFAVSLLDAICISSLLHSPSKQLTHTRYLSGILNHYSKPSVTVPMALIQVKGLPLAKEKTAYVSIVEPLLARGSDTV